MGVIYKLKENVVSFILNKKQEDPQFSCRKLVQVIQEQFQVSVSKSSINNVIKQAQLSSPVGRRPKSPKAPKFTIPQKKKEELYEAAKQFLPESSAVQAQPQEEAQVSNEFLETPPFVQQKPLEESLQGKIQPLIESDLPVDKTVKFQKEIIKFPGMDRVFVLSTFIELMPRVFWRRFLKDGDQLSDQMVDLVLCLLSCADFSKPDIAINMEQLKGLRMLCGWQDEPDGQMVQKALNILKDLNTKTLELSLEWESIVKKSDRVEIFLEDGTGFVLDPHFVTIWDKECYKDNIERFFERTVEQIPEVLFNNTEPCVLLMPFDQGQNQEDLMGRFWSCFENLPDKSMNRIAIKKGGELLAEFSGLPRQKRFFLMGVPLDKKEFKKIFLQMKIEEVKSCERGSLDIIDFIDGHGEVSVEQGSIPVRLIPFSKHGQGEFHFAVLTNIADDKMSCEEILERFLTRWSVSLEDCGAMFGRVKAIENHGMSIQNEGPINMEEVEQAGGVLNWIQKKITNIFLHTINLEKKVPIDQIEFDIFKINTNLYIKFKSPLPQVQPHDVSLFRPLNITYIN